MIAIIDYGAGNIKSLKNALDYLNIKNVLTNNIDEIKQSDKIILPGVGAFPSAMEKLNNCGLSKVLKSESKNKPLLGICLGMQLLFDKSFEFSECEGLSLINGKVDIIPSEDLIIPHMGWNELIINHENRLLSGVANEYVYFVHSYQAYCKKDENLISYCQYGNLNIPAVVHDGNYVYGTQFHPEKSGDVGLRILQNFGEI